MFKNGTSVNSDDRNVNKLKWGSVSIWKKIEPPYSILYALLLLFATSKKVTHTAQYLLLDTAEKYVFL